MRKTSSCVTGGASQPTRRHSVAPFALQDAQSRAEPSLFGRFAGHWFPAIVDVLIGSIQAPEQAGVHYLLLDACVTFLGWDALFPMPPRGEAASQLMSYLVSYELDCFLLVMTGKPAAGHMLACPSAPSRALM